MATLDDVVESNILNAELLQDIHSRQMDELQIKGLQARYLETLANDVKRQQKARAEQNRERTGRGAPTNEEIPPSATGESAFSSAFGDGPLVGAGAGMAAVGAGIAAFMIGISAADKTMAWMNTDMEALKRTVGGLDDVFQSLSDEGMMGIGALLAAGGAFGALFGPARSAYAGVGMGALGFGIGAFFAGLAAGDAAASYLNADGQALGDVMVNVARGLGAFAEADSTGMLSGMLAAGALFGQAPGVAAKGAVGMGIIGLGIGAFFSGLGANDAALRLMKSDGSTLGDMMENTARGLKALGEVPVGNLLALAAAMPVIGAGIVGLVGTEGLASLGDAIGSFFGGDEGPSIFEKMAADLETLSDVDVSKLDGFTMLGDSFFKLGDGLDKLADVDISDVEENLIELSKTVATIMPVFDKMWNGGVIGDGYFDGYPEMDFGDGLKNTPVVEIGNSLSKVASFPIADTVQMKTNEAVQQATAPNVVQVNNNTQVDNSNNSTNVSGGSTPPASPTKRNGTKSDGYGIPD